MKTIAIINPAEEAENSFRPDLQADFNLLELNNVESLFSFLAHSRVDAVIIDDSIKWIKIFNLMHYIKIIEHSIPVIISTKSRTVQSVVKYMKCGASEVIFKPYDPALLLKILDALVSRGDLPEHRRECHSPVYSVAIRSTPVSGKVCKMNAKNVLHSIRVDLKGRVLNSDMSFDEAMKIFEDKAKYVCVG
jgi:DNA-binding NtrC family response regulator